MTKKRFIKSMVAANVAFLLLSLVTGVIAWKVIENGSEYSNSLTRPGNVQGVSSSNSNLVLNLNSFDTPSIFLKQDDNDILSFLVSNGVVTELIKFRHINLDLSVETQAMVFQEKFLYYIEENLGEYNVRKYNLEGEIGTIFRSRNRIIGLHSVKQTGKAYALTELTAASSIQAGRYNLIQLNQDDTSENIAELSAYSKPVFMGQVNDTMYFRENSFERCYQLNVVNKAYLEISCPAARASTDNSPLVISRHDKKTPASFPDNVNFTEKIYLRTQLNEYEAALAAYRQSLATQPAGSQVVVTEPIYPTAIFTGEENQNLSFLAASKGKAYVMAESSLINSRELIVFNSASGSVEKRIELPLAKYVDYVGENLQAESLFFSFSSSQSTRAEYLYHFDTQRYQFKNLEASSCSVDSEICKFVMVP